MLFAYDQILWLILNIYNSPYTVLKYSCRIVLEINTKKYIYIYMALGGMESVRRKIYINVNIGRKCDNVLLGQAVVHFVGH